MAIACYLNLLSSSYTLSLIDLIIAMVLIHLKEVQCGSVSAFGDSWRMQLALLQVH